MQESGVVEAQQSPGTNRKRPIIVVFVLLLVLAGAAVYMFLSRHSDSVKTTKAPQNLSGAALDDAINQANAKKDYTKAAELMAQNKSSDPQDQIKLALAYYNNKQYKEALEIFDKLDQAGKLNSAYTETAAQAAESAGDKAKAIEYYQAAKKKVQEEKMVTAESRIEVYDQRIKSLGGQP